MGFVFLPFSVFITSVDLRQWRINRCSYQCGTRMFNYTVLTAHVIFISFYPWHGSIKPSSHFLLIIYTMWLQCNCNGNCNVYHRRLTKKKPCKNKQLKIRSKKLILELHSNTNCDFSISDIKSGKSLHYCSAWVVLIYWY